MENELNIRQLFFFDAMLTPTIITFVYWLALLGSVIGGISVMFFSGAGFWGFIKGIFFMAGGLVAARVYCELMIVIFKINDNLKRLSAKEQVIDQ